MCPIPGAVSGDNDASSAGQKESKPYFTCTRLNPSTFLVIEDDKWEEEPYIYVKICSTFLVLIDTGCGGVAKPNAAGITDLRQYLETFPVADNDGQPLNPGSQKSYVVVCTHCHFDHIGGTEQFNDESSEIWASGYKRDVLDKDVLPTTSLCRFMDIKTPEYTVGRWANDGERMTFKGEQLNMTIYHTPGHTLDQVAIWDSDERVLFVGDTMYEYAHILFPLEGSIPLYSDSIGKLKSLVRGWNAEASQRVKMACGHNTRAADAETLLNEVDEMLYGVMMKKFKEIDRGEERDQQQVSFQRDDLKIKFFGPKQYFEDFRDIPAAMKSLADRQSKTET